MLSACCNKPDVIYITPSIPTHRLAETPRPDCVFAKVEDLLDCLKRTTIALDQSNKDKQAIKKLLTESGK